MSRPYTGGCACGAIRYKIPSEPVAMLDCQCRQCQHESGTGHASHLTFPREGVEVEGQPSVWEVTGDGGTTKIRAFCSACGSPVFMTFVQAPTFFSVRAGSLDEPERYKPQMVTWASTAQPWDHLDPGIPKFEKMPPG